MFKFIVEGLLFLGVIIAAIYLYRWLVKPEPVTPINPVASIDELDKEVDQSVEQFTQAKQKVQAVEEKVKAMKEKTK